jgi:23S rRNA U2552 (ribose-2'-O)-methylase RlmE/FtsJ
MVLAIDRDHMDPVNGAKFHQGDIKDPIVQEIISEFFK